MQELSNALLKIAVKDIGAELCKITSVKNDTDFMWSGDPDIWSGIAPNLFPIIGCMKDDSYIYEGKTYHMPKHGFLRRSDAIVLVGKTENSLTYRLTSSPGLLKLFPFEFEFYMTYTLNENTLSVDHIIKNVGSKKMYFSLGGHPAFRCVLHDDESYDDYSLVFEHNETAETYLLNSQNFLQTSKTEKVFDENSNIIKLRYDLFDKDALIFKDLKSRAVTLHSKTKGDILTMRFEDFPYLGIWAKPNADYVCIEPWIGIADHEDTDRQLKTKEGIMALEARTQFRATYSIQVDKKQLS
jgi:galactose mutarotase-like enzyme